MNEHEERRSDILSTAQEYVNKDRNLEYTEPSEDFVRISAGWQWWLETREDEKLGRGDVAAMMILMKLARTASNPVHKDSWIDIAGYAACGYDVAMEDWEKLGGMGRPMTGPEVEEYLKAITRLPSYPMDKWFPTPQTTDDTYAEHGWIPGPEWQEVPNQDSYPPSQWKHLDRTKPWDAA